MKMCHGLFRFQRPLDIGEPTRVPREPNLLLQPLSSSVPLWLVFVSIHVKFALECVTTAFNERNFYLYFNDQADACSASMKVRLKHALTLRPTDSICRKQM
jgi:hypothetical protein